MNLGQLARSEALWVTGEGREGGEGVEQAAATHRTTPLESDMYDAQHSIYHRLQHHEAHPRLYVHE